MHNKTYNSLLKWYKKEVEKFGWLIILKNESFLNHTGKTEKTKFCTYKIYLYIKTLEKLLYTIDNKILSVTCNDKKNDLEIMKLKLSIFIPYVSQYLSDLKYQSFNSDTINETNDIISVNNSYDITFHGISKWFKHIVEKFGWMVMFCQDINKDLNDAKYKKLKIDNYIKSLNILLNSTKFKIQKYTNESNYNIIQIDDLKIITNKLQNNFINNINEIFVALLDFSYENKLIKSTREKLSDDEQNNLLGGGKYIIKK